MQNINPVLEIIPEDKTAGQRARAKAIFHLVVIVISSIVAAVIQYFAGNPFTWLALAGVIGGQLIQASITVANKYLSSQQDIPQRVIVQTLAGEALKRLPSVSYTPELAGVQQQLQEQLPAALDAVMADVKAAKQAA